MLANGVGTITAGGNIGAPTASGGFALSLVKGSWNISAPNGSIYLQDVRNPNGVFNDKGNSRQAYAGYHLFDYDPSCLAHSRRWRFRRNHRARARRMIFPPLREPVFLSCFPPTLQRHGRVGRVRSGHAM